VTLARLTQISAHQVQNSCFQNLRLQILKRCLDRKMTIRPPPSFGYLEQPTSPASHQKYRDLDVSSFDCPTPTVQTLARISPSESRRDFQVAFDLRHPSHWRPTHLHRRQRSKGGDTASIDGEDESDNMMTQLFLERVFDLLAGLREVAQHLIFLAMRLQFVVANSLTSRYLELALQNLAQVPGFVLFCQPRNLLLSEWRQIRLVGEFPNSRAFIAQSRKRRRR